MGLIPAGEAGKILQWYDTGSGYALRNRTMDDLLDEIASTGPTASKYYLDVSGTDVAALLNAALGHGAAAPLTVAAGAVFSLSAVSGAGSIGSLLVGTGAAVTTSLVAVSGQGSTGGVTAVAGLGVKLAAVSGQGTAAPLTVATPDTTAPAVVTLTVTPGAGTACTFSVTATDAVGVVKWLLVEGASDPGAADPGQTGATSVASTTSLSLSAQAFTSTASATGTRYWRLHCWDAAGNHGVSAVASATVTIASSGEKVTRTDPFDAPPQWNATTTYALGDLVSWSPEIRRSLQNGNINHSPSALAPWWESLGINVGKPLGANWTTLTGTNPPYVFADGGAGSRDAVAAAYWSADAFGADQFCEAVGGSSAAVRMSATARTGYHIELEYDWGTDDGSMTLHVYREVAGVKTQLPGSGGNVGKPTVWRMEAVGSRLVIKANGATVFDYTDPSPIASGQPGIWAVDSFTQSVTLGDL